MVGKKSERNGYSYWNQKALTGEDNGFSMVLIIRKDMYRRGTFTKNMVNVPLLIFKQLKKTDMKDLRLKFKGIDDWNRPVFMDDNGRYLVIQISICIQLVR